MTVSSTTSRKAYTGDGVTTSFSTSPVVFLSSSDLVVYAVTTATGAATTLTENTHYTVSGGSGSTGTVNLAGGTSPYGAPSAAQTLVIVRSVPATQGSDFVNNDPNDAEVLETALDKLTMLAQQNKNAVTRTLRQPTADATDIAELPIAADRASTYLAFDSNGDPVATAGTTSSYVVSTFMQTVLDDTTAAAARTTLGAAASGANTDITSLNAPALGAATATTAAARDNSTKVATTAYVEKTAAYPPMFIQGLTYSNNGSDATNDLDIAAGAARDATDTINMRLASALTKQSDAAWAVGTNAGGLDTGAVGDNDYYIWFIKRSDTGVVDALYSLSASAPTMPANYDYKRLIGWFKRSGGAIVAFHTYETEGGGIELNWDVPTLDVNLANTLTTSRRTDAVKVPLNFSVEAHLNVSMTDVSSIFRAWVCCPDQTDAAPSTTAAPLSNVTMQTGTGMNTVAAQIKVRTSSAGLIAARADLATVDLYAVSTMGFKWARRN